MYMCWVSDNLNLAEGFPPGTLFSSIKIDTAGGIDLVGHLLVSVMDRVYDFVKWIKF